MDMAEHVNDIDAYLSELQLSLKYRDTKEFRRLVFTKQALEPGYFWDVSTEICKHFTADIFNEAPGFFETCREGLHYLIDNGNAKELLIVILEHVDDENDDLKYQILMEATQKALLKVPTRRVQSLDIAIESLLGHVNSLNQPDEQKLEGEEKKLLEGDTQVSRIGEILGIFLHFLQPFVWEVSQKNFENVRKTNGHQIKTLTKTLLKLLDHPLLYVDLSHTDDSGTVSKTRCRQAAESAVLFLSELQLDFHKLIVQTLDANTRISKRQRNRIQQKQASVEYSAEKDSHVIEEFDLEEPVPEFGLACLTYLVLGEQLGCSNWPSVFHPVYTFTYCLKFINKLLRKQESLVVYKGIFLTESLLDKIAKKSLDSDLLELEEYTDFVLGLMGVMQLCSVQELRQLSVKLLPGFVNKFTLIGRYKLMEFILHKTTHSGIAGLVIQMIKEQIAAILKSAGPGQVFVGQPLEKLLTLALTLPNGATTDLLDQSDRIMAGLNLVRFMILSDPQNVNRTGLWSRMDVLEMRFLEPLKTGINMSRAHYEMELKNTRECKNSEEIELTVNIGGVESPMMSKEQKIQVLQSALVTFDLMASIHGRVSELISMSKNLNK